MSPPLESLLKTLPDTPGVYEMKNEEGETLYVGKAKNLKNRVKTYFQQSVSHSARIQKMVDKVHHVEWTTVSSEWEALVLESNLIKEKRPKFNVLLRDDKNFSYIRVSVQEDFPMITIARKVIKDGSLYFGPKTSSAAVRNTIDLLQNIFRFRTTPLDLSLDSNNQLVVKNAGNTKFPCLNFHLKKCDAPCIGKISKTEYHEKIKQAVAFLKGDTLDIQLSLEEKMKEYALEGKFELAAKTRDYLFAVQDITKKQLVSAPTDFSADIVGIHSQFGHVFFHVFAVRSGKLINSETFPVAIHQKNLEKEDIEEAIFRFFQEYQSYSSGIPEKIIVPDNTLDLEVWTEYFSTLFGKKVEVFEPQKGDKKKLLELATQNASEYARRHAASFIKHEEDPEDILKILQTKLKMEKFPKRIECYDISHFSGEKTYASMVVFENGVAKNKDYRIFSIKSLEHRGIDDFASLAEATRRRLKRLPQKLETSQKWAKITRKKDLEILSEISKEFTQQEGEWWGIFETTEETKNELLFSSVFCKEEKEDALHAFFLESFDPQFFPLLESILEKNNHLPWIFHTNHSLEMLSCEKISENQWKREKGYKRDSSFSSFPDLMVIDGGKGQLSTTFEVLEELSYSQKISICSLAKQEEEVFVPFASDPIAIAKNSPEGKLLQRIRDEAHRFAITKNRTEREKSAQKSVLDDIKGLGPKTKKQLKEAFGSIASIANASDEELLKYLSSGVLKELRKKI